MEEIINNIRNHGVSAKRKFDQMEGELESIKVLYRDVIDKAEEVIKEKENVESIDYDLGKRTINECEKIDVVKKFEKPFMDLIEKVVLLQSTINNTLRSNILTLQQTKDLIYLIDMPISTKWKLIYRGSRDGFGAKDFHYHCDNKPNTLTIIKTTNGNIFGGFTEAQWGTNGRYKNDVNAYLFVLKSKKNTPTKLPIVNDDDDDDDTNNDDEYSDNNSDYYETEDDGEADHKEAIQCRMNCGPVFGINELCIADNANSNQDSKALRLSSYSKKNFTSLADTETFKVEDIEVFQKI